MIIQKSMEENTMNEQTLLTAWERDKFYEVKKYGRVDHLRTVIPYGEPVKYANVYFHNFADEQDIISNVTYEFAVRLRQVLPEVIQKAYDYAEAEDLICCYDSRTGAIFDFSVFQIDKERPSAFYVGFDAGDAPDSDPDNFEYMELYRYIGFNENFEPTGDIYDESIWR